MIVSAISILLASYPLDLRPIVQIGTVDRSTFEFAYAKGQYRNYSSDPVFIAGVSKASDWSYVLPGPDDGWAKAKPHAGTVCFGLNGLTNTSQVVFRLDLADAQYSTPPKLRLVVNGQTVGFFHASRGKGDASIEGNPESGNPSHWQIAIPAKVLRNGGNVLRVRNEAGSWALFDALSIEASDEVELTPFEDKTAFEVLPADPIVLRSPNGPVQPVRIEVTRFGGPAEAKVKLGSEVKTFQLEPGAQVVEMTVPQVSSTKKFALTIDAGDDHLESSATVSPVRKWEVRLIPHSHVDIGYTDLQPFLLKMHQRNITDAIAVAKESASNPVGSRYVLNNEAMWPFDRFLQSASKTQKQAITNGFRSGALAASAGYCNLLTGLMRPEEMMRSYALGLRVQRELGVQLDTVSQTDVPGVTWGDVTALTQAGVKNLVLMPNFGDRIGGVSKWWRDKPFFWVGPNGKDKVFVWETVQYGIGHGIRGWDGNRTRIIRGPDPITHFIDSYIFDDIRNKSAAGYPYDIIALPWSCSDNGPVDAGVGPAAKAWNEKYVTPKVVVSSLSDTCAEFKKRYANKIPVVKGDFTPYWEDGAGSSAAETALNRESADQLVQAEALAAMMKPKLFNAEAFREAWRNVLLYTEHTWGAWNSISDPDAQNVKDQWKIKQGFALDAHRLSKKLLGGPAATASTYDVVNTTSWPRTDLVMLSATQSKGRDRVLDELGKPLPSQRMVSGELAVLVRNVPALGSKRVLLTVGKAFVDQKVKASATALKSSQQQVAVNPSTGAIEEWAFGAQNFAGSGKHKLNEYVFALGAGQANLSTPQNASVKVVERGPLVGVLRVTSKPNGVKSLTQEIRLVAGLDRVDITNVLDKTAVREKESVHFAFPFNVPNGQMRIDTPFAVIRPEKDQLPGANKNWFCAQRFVDVSNEKYGVTCAVLDAPLMEVGSITADMPGSQMNPEVWVQHLKPTQTFYSWALNNHWHTNYRADQEGRLTFRYSLTRHGAFKPEEAAKFGTGLSQPLLVRATTPKVEPIVKLNDPSVLITSLRPSDDRRAVLVRLYGASGQTRKVKLTWRKGAVKTVHYTDLREIPLAKTNAEVTVPANGVISLRAELAE